MADCKPQIHKPNEEPKSYKYTADHMLDQLPKEASISDKIHRNRRSF